MLMRVHTRVSSPHAEHSAIKGQQSRVEQSLVLNCLSEVGGFLTNFYWTACSSWVGALLVLSEAVFCLHKLLAPHAVPNTLHKLQAGYLIWRAFFFFFFCIFGHSFCFCCLGDKGISEVLSLHWIQVSAEIILVSRNTYWRELCFLDTGSWWSWSLLDLWASCIFKKGEICHSPVRSSALQNRSSYFLVSSGNHRRTASVFGPQINLLFTQQKL